MSNTSRERVADLKEFPFDVQQCAFHIGSWNDHGNEVLLKPGSIDMTSAWSPNQEFKIEPLSFWRESKFYPCCTEPWPELFASLKFSRCAYRHHPVLSVSHLSAASCAYVQILNSM